MRTISELISRLHRQRIRLSINGDNLAYKAPKGAMIPELRRELTDRKEEILEFLREVEMSTRSAPPPMLPVDRDGDLPLSFSQRRLWFFDQLLPNSSMYNLSNVVRLIGPLNVVALQKALNEIVRRHEVLRTSFSSADGLPIQVISENINLAVPIADLEELPEAERESEARRLATEEVRRPFDLSQAPLLRARLLRLNEKEHVFILVMHHISSDGWSMGILRQELSTLYEAFATGGSYSLPELPIQYADFAAWQRNWLQGDALKAQLSYWREQLAKVPPVLELPADGLESADQAFRGENQILRLSKSLSESLNDLCRQENVTLFIAMLAAFKILLHRLTGQENIVVGSPIAGRNYIEIEGLIGFFINSLVLHTDLSGDPTFLDLLERVREVCLGAYGHQDMPFEKLVEELQPDRWMSQTPFFRVWFNMVNLENREWELHDLEVKPFPAFGEHTKFPLTLYVWEQDDGIQVNMLYDSDLFGTERMTEMLDQYEYLLEQINADPKRPICSYSLMTSRALSVLPDPAAPIPEPEHKPVTSLFAGWADRTPEHSAVYQDGRSWTYKELHERARNIALNLVAGGVKPGDVVAISGERSFGLIASIMGTLMSRGVMLILDTRFPSQRQQVMVREAGAKYLIYVGKQQIGDEWMRESLRVIDVDADTGQIPDSAERKIGNLDLPEVLSEDAAYVFFTSGTTGVPKGILGWHKGISHFLNWQRETYEIQQSDRCAQLMSISFDAVMRDILLPLISGAILCLPGRDDSVVDSRILTWLERERISLIHIVPSLAQEWLLDVPPGISLSASRFMFFTGEPLTDKLVSRWRAAFPESGEIVNLYGPTETTLIKCYYRVPDETRPGVQPVGWPISETQALVLSPDNQVCGIGEPGEIVLRTPFRTLGYINDQEGNSQCFVVNPFRDDERDLLYYTGDGGRYLPDGCLEILGRLDDQIKIRGVRIEPGEIESLLDQHPSVSRTAVIARDDVSDDKCLVVYIAMDKSNPTEIAELRRFLQQRLPEYMIPSFFVILNALPLMPNGKVDRRALPIPDAAQLESDKPYVAPRTLMEQQIADIWAEILGLNRVGVYHNFFELGGHSLLATRVVSRLRKNFKIEIPLRILFEMPTVERLAEFIEIVQMNIQTNESIPEAKAPGQRQERGRL